MAVLIVIYLEIVNVNEQYRKPVVSSGDLTNFLVNNIFDGLTIVNSGQRIIACSLYKLHLTPLGSVNIRQHAYNLHYVPVVVTDSGSFHGHPNIIAVNVFPTVGLVLEFLAFLQHCKILAVTLVVLRMHSAFNKETVAEMIRRRTITEFFIKVV